MKTVNKGRNKSARFNKDKGWSEKCSWGGHHTWVTSKVATARLRAQHQTGTAQVCAKCKTMTRVAPGGTRRLL